MGDTLEAGSERRAPRWLPPLVVTALAIGVGYAVLHRGDGAPSATPSATPSAPGVLTPTPADTRPAGAPWPSEASACGATVDLPLLSAAALEERTGLQVLVGGAGLRRVDIDSGRIRMLHITPNSHTGKVTDLARSADGTHAVSLRCPIPGQYPIGRVLAVRGQAVAPVTRLGRADELLAASDRTWAVRYDLDPGQPARLRPISGGRTVQLPDGLSLAAATRQAFIAEAGSDGGKPGHLVAVPRDGTPVAQDLGAGWLLAANDRVVISVAQCSADADGPCVLTRIRDDGSERKFILPAGRQPVSGGVLDDSGRYVAFQLARPEPDPRFELGHPGGPSDIAVLDLGSVHLTVVPGVELAPKASAGLAFSTGGRWLVIALNEGSRTRLLVWRPGLDRPRESPARLPGRVLYNVPVLVTQG